MAKQKQACVFDDPFGLIAQPVPVEIITFEPTLEQVADEAVAMLVEKLGEAENKISVMRVVLEGAVMFPDVRTHIQSKYPGLVLQMQQALESVA